MTERPEQTRLAAQFAANGYIVVRSAIAGTQSHTLFGVIEAAHGRSTTPVSDEMVPGTPSAYGSFVSEKLLVHLQPVIEDAVGLSLFPTYSYLRLYKHGDELRRHTDRQSCEISASLCVGYRPDAPWTLWVESLGRAVPVALQPGDMLIYRGIEVPHWREAYAGERLAQVFLHYVDQNGPHTEWKFDKRPGLHAPAVARR